MERLDETVPGGRYLNSEGDVVDADGKAIEKQPAKEEPKTKPKTTAKKKT